LQAPDDLLMQAQLGHLPPQQQVTHTHNVYTCACGPESGWYAAGTAW
jgi:hypothetical protein